MIGMICGVRLVDRLLTDVLRDRVGVVGKTEYILSEVVWSCHA